MDFLDNNPGAVRLGNFINYYQFHPADERIKLLPNNVWLPTAKDLETSDQSPFLVLDVGCNAGDLTKYLHEFLSRVVDKEVYILGVDIDSRLIKTAGEKYSSERISFETVDVMKPDEFSVVEKFLQSHNARKFSALCCFSVTMWIHLNHGDNGLKDFLQKCSSLCELLVVEPQPWPCYRNAVRRLKRSGNEYFQDFDKLMWRKDVELEIQNFLETNLKRDKVHETSETKWMRKICFYR